MDRTRRLLVKLGFCGFATRLPAREKEIRREPFLPPAGKGVMNWGGSYYTRRTGGELMSIEQRLSRSDTIDVAYVRGSADNGRTWSKPREWATGERRNEGMLRRHPRGGFVDPCNGRFVNFWNEGILPNDDPLEGMRQWNIHYTVSADGGKSHGGVRQVIHRGPGFDPKHPLPTVYTGKNCVMIGDVAEQAIALPDGGIALPAIVTPVGPDGKLANPGGGYTWTEAIVLFGRWRGMELEWEASPIVKGDPARTTRGMDEPTLAVLRGKRMIMVLRGSNDKQGKLPGYRWVSYSDDLGRTWTEPAPWTYTTGERFFSPSSCSALLEHSSGRLFWLGNVSPSNPRGNRPRYPFWIGEVDRDSGKLIRDSLRMVDDRKPGESELLALSNFVAREDRETKEVVLHLTRFFPFPEGFQGEANLYRIEV